MGFKNASKPWLGKLIAAFMSIVGFASGSIAILQYFTPTDGEFLAILNNEKVVPPVTRNLLIYMDKDSVDINPLKLMPQFSNPTKYAVEDLLLTYNVDYQNASVRYTDYYTIHSVTNGEEVRNSDKTLYPLTEQPEAFMAFVMKDRSKASVRIRATYKGVDKPFEYEVSMYAKRLWDSDSTRRAREVMEDAYLYTSANSVDSVDIYVLEGETVASYTGTSASILQYAHEAASTPQTAQKPTSPQQPSTTARDAVTTSPGVTEPTATVKHSRPQPVVKTVTQIKEEVQEVVEEAKEEHGTPWQTSVIKWVLIIIGWIGAIITGILFIFFLSDGLEDSKWNKRIALWGTILYVLTYTSFYYYDVLSDNNPLKYFGGLVIIYICSILTILAIGIMDKIKFIYTLGLWILYFVILCCLIIFIYPLFPF